MTAPLLTKQCNWCGEFQPLDCFAKNKRTRDGRQYYCRLCYAEDNRERREKGGVKFRVHQRVAATKRRRILQNDPEKRELAAERNRRSVRINGLKRQIAVATCERLGIDLTKLAKEQYDAEQRSKET